MASALINSLVVGDVVRAGPDPFYDAPQNEKANIDAIKKRVRADAGPNLLWFLAKSQNRNVLAYTVNPSSRSVSHLIDAKWFLYDPDTRMRELKKIGVDADDGRVLTMDMTEAESHFFGVEVLCRTNKHTGSKVYLITLNVAEEIDLGRPIKYQLVKDAATGSYTCYGEVVDAVRPDGSKASDTKLMYVDYAYLQSPKGKTFGATYVHIYGTDCDSGARVIETYKSSTS